MPERESRAAAMRLISAAWESQCVRVAVELGIPDLLGDGPMTGAELAAATEADAPHMGRLLRALVTLEVLEAGDGGRFALTPTGVALRSDALGPAALFFASDVQWQNWGALSHCVLTGRRAFDHVQGMRNWDYYAAHPEMGALFDAAMAAMTSGAVRAIVAAYDFGRHGRVVDVGGGDGTLLAEILRANPGVRGVLMDREHVVERARPGLEAAGVLARCELFAGDFSDGVPPGGDAYVLKSVLHDWADAEATALLGRCRSAMAPEGAVVVVERVVPERVSAADRAAVLSDLNMMVNNGGRERTEREFAALGAAAGLRLARTLPTGTPVSVLELVADA
jgi:precorrin-6B methylase 2